MSVLSGLRVIEFAAIGPVPWASMLLADLGAEVVRIDRAGSPAPDTPTNRGRISVELDLKTNEGRIAAQGLIGGADVMLEGMRPGALERLGLEPEVIWKVNPGLVIGRMTGWGQAGPLANRAGHDINYIALSGVLHAIGRDKPVPPLNLVGDYGGGGAFLLIGVLSAVIGARLTGKGRIVDAAMIDGAASVMTLAYERMMIGKWIDQRASNSLDGGTPWYDVYETSDGKFMAVGCNELAFYRIFLTNFGLDPASVPDRNERDNWPQLRELFSAHFARRTRDEWASIFEHVDACVTPVLSMLEAPHHPHNLARSTFTQFNGHPVPGAAPKFIGDQSSIAPSSVRMSADDVTTRWARRVA